MVRRNKCMLVCLICLAMAVLACGDQECVGPEPSGRTLIDELREFCFCGANDCEDYSVDLLLHLDTVNLPSSGTGGSWLILSSLPTTPIADGNDRLGLEFVGALGPEIDPGILDQVGWKVRITNARIRYCQRCYTNSGLVPVIYLTASLSNVEFVLDQADTLEIYINTSRAP